MQTPADVVRLLVLSELDVEWLRNHKAVVALYVAHYNLCRVHETLRITPAMALGIMDHVWSAAELVEAANRGGADCGSPALRSLPGNPGRTSVGP